MSKRYHVVPDSDGRWALKRAGRSTSDETFHRKADAVDAARKVARKSGGELVIHGRDGRIREADTYPKGYGSLKGEYVLRKGIDFTRPLYQQSMKKAGPRR